MKRVMLWETRESLLFTQMIEIDNPDRQLVISICSSATAIDDRRSVANQILDHDRRDDNDNRLCGCGGQAFGYPRSNENPDGPFTVRCDSCLASVADSKLPWAWKLWNRAMSHGREE